MSSRRRLENVSSHDTIMRNMNAIRGALEAYIQTWQFMQRGSQYSCVASRCESKAEFHHEEAGTGRRLCVRMQEVRI